MAFIHSCQMSFLLKTQVLNYKSSSIEYVNKVDLVADAFVDHYRPVLIQFYSFIFVRVINERKLHWNIRKDVRPHWVIQHRSINTHTQSCFCLIYQVENNDHK